MPSPVVNLAVARAAERLPLLKRLPLARLVIVAEVAILARTHYERLTPAERRRLVVLLRETKGRPSTLPAKRRRELESLVNKLEPKLFAKTAVEKFSPVPLSRS